MDTKERKTPVRRPAQSAGPKSWRPAPLHAAKIELEKPKFNFKGIRENFSARFSRG